MKHWKRRNFFDTFLPPRGMPLLQGDNREAFSDPKIKEFIQKNFDIVEINIRGSQSITLSNDEVIDERAFP